MECRIVDLVENDDEARCYRLTAHTDDGEEASGLDVMLRWFKTPNEEKNKVWSGKPQITMQGRMKNRSPREVMIASRMMARAATLAETLASEDGIEETDWTEPLDLPDFVEDGEEG